MSSMALSPGNRGFSASRLDRRSSPLVLTRRGRVVVTAILVALLLSVLVAFSARSAATNQPGTPVPTRMVQVTPGDTLWAIAAGVAAPGHVREMVRQIEELNALPEPSLRVGQEIAVPRVSQRR